MHQTSSETHPSPDTLYPIKGVTRTVYLKNCISRANISVGDYTYYDDPDDVANFEKNVLYHFDFIGDRLIIGKFCQIAAGVRFIMNGANHAMDGLSTYPFKIFGHTWADAPLHSVSKGDTVIGNDVWIGNAVTFMPGVTVGDGAIIGANSVVAKNVSPYSIVGGNPAELIRLRFDEATVETLCALKWWDWPVEQITRHLNVITSGDVESLRKVHKG